MSALFGWGWPGSSVLTIGATGLVPRGVNWCGAPASPRLASPRLVYFALRARLASPRLFCGARLPAPWTPGARGSLCAQAARRAEAARGLALLPYHAPVLGRAWSALGRSRRGPCPSSAPLPLESQSARGRASLHGAHLERRGGGRAGEGTPHAAPPARGGRPPAHRVPGLPEPEVHVYSACRPRQGGLAEAPAPPLARLPRRGAHQSSSHKTRCEAPRRGRKHLLGLRGQHIVTDRRSGGSHGALRGRHMAPGGPLHGALCGRWELLGGGR